MTKRQYINNWDNRTKRILGFFVGKGLLAVTDIQPCPSVKLDIEEVVRTGLEREQRILEVLPAAMLRFPRSFLNWHKVPEKLKIVLDCLKKGKEQGPDLAGIPYKDLRKWANYELPDKRTVPVKERRVMKSLRLKPSTLTAIKRLAAESGKSESAIIEAAFPE